MKAIVHNVSPRIAECELTHAERQPIDFELAQKQHADYCTLLQKLGAEIIYLQGNEDLPDSTFVEDTAVVFDEVAVIASMGVTSRRPEIKAMEKELARHHMLARIHSPATLEGGDVVTIGNTVFVGRTQRTNDAGIDALRHLLTRFDYTVVAMDVKDCLHFKSACTAISGRSLLVNPDWLTDLTPLSEFNVITVDESEPWAANTVCIGNTVCVHAGFPKTAQLLRDLDFTVRTIDISEFIKAEGGLSCLSVRF